MNIPSLAALSVAAVAREQLKWLWPGRIPLAQLTILEGDPGLGKSLILLDVAARLSRGQPMPLAPPESALQPSGVVLMSAEDALGAIIRPRLEAAGADLRRITAMARDVEKPPLLLPRDLSELRQLLKETDARLLIIDPVVCFLEAGINWHVDQSIRRVLGPLAALAEEARAAIVLVRHLSKEARRKALYRGLGSIGLVAAARAALLVAADPEDSERRYLAVNKPNLAAPAKAFAYAFESAGSSVKVRWLGESAHDLETLLAPPLCAGGKSELAEAVQFLRQALAAGPVLAASIVREALAIGIAKRTLQRAKGRLGVESTFVSKDSGLGGYWVWSVAA